MQPLADRMRPESLKDYFGQTHLIGQGRPLHSLIEQGHPPSMILFGPPGTGKTTLAHIIAKESQKKFVSLSAVHSGVKDVREVIDSVEKNDLFNAREVLLFIDEIHRFNKSQQDSLLTAIEKGSIILIGATTENPAFEINRALLSRCQVYNLEPLSESDLHRVIDRSLEEDVVLQAMNAALPERGLLIEHSGGDARKLLNLIEIVLAQAKNKKPAKEEIKSILGHSPVHYDKKGDYHYDIISAYIKAIRGSDPNAAIYWLALMIEGGEKPEFIARRLIISASEDIGLANPTALVIANSCFQSVNVIGLPEARIILAQCTIYLACSEKSNSAYLAINNAQKHIKEHGGCQVPSHLRSTQKNTLTSDSNSEEYRYPHDFANNFIKQKYLPDEVKNSDFYKPAANQREKEYYTKLHSFWADFYNFQK